MDFLFLYASGPGQLWSNSVGDYADVKFKKPFLIVPVSWKIHIFQFYSDVDLVKLSCIFC